MDQELKAFLEEQFAQVNQQFGQMGERFDRMEARVDRMEERADRMEETLRHTQISVEGVRGDVRLVAEGLAGLTERFETFQEETAKNFKKVEGSIAFHFENLNGRVRILEERPRRPRRDP